MATHSAERAQRREVWLGSALLLAFGCSVLGLVVAKDRVSWMSVDHVRANLSHAMAKLGDDLAHPLEDVLDQ